LPADELLSDENESGDRRDWAMGNFVKSKLATEKYYGKVEVPKVVTLRLERQDEEIESIR
jgi:hypothetical protein